MLKGQNNKWLRPLRNVNFYVDIKQYYITIFKKYILYIRILKICERRFLNKWKSFLDVFCLHHWSSAKFGFKFLINKNSCQINRSGSRNISCGDKNFVSVQIKWQIRWHLGAEFDIRERIFKIQLHFETPCRYQKTEMERNHKKSEN